MVTGGGTVAAAVPCGGGNGATVPPADTTTRRPNENRRSNKPIMEKRRRARINNCLNELKSLILDAMKKDPARHSKLEKADILEMTVKHLETMQRQQVAMSAATDPQVLNKFRAGFSECAGEVGRFPGLEPPVRRRLLQHLANCLNSSTMAENGASPPIETQTTTSAATPTTGVQLHIVPSVDAQITASNGIFFSTGTTGGGLQLVPTRLPNGDIALVLPSSGTNQIFRQVAISPSSASPASPAAAQVFRQVNSPSTSPAPSSGNGQMFRQGSSPSTSPSPSLSSTSTSPSPLPMLIPIQTRTTSTSPEHPSPVAFDRLSVSTAHNPQQDCSVHQSFPSPISPQSSSYDMSESSMLRPYSPPLQKPLSLVVKKDYHEHMVEDEKPWRPW